MTLVERERRPSGAEILRLNRPDRLNAFDTALLGALNGALAELADDGDVRVLVLSTTSEAALSAGADVDERLDAGAGMARMEAFTRLYDLVAAFPVPTIAVCVGHCVGAGVEMAAGCDLRVAGENLRARWAGGVLGVPVGPARLEPLVGGALARDLVLTGRRLGAEEALRAGFVRSVHPPAEAEAAALELAEDLAARPPEGLRALKRLFGDLGAMRDRVDAENRALLEFQRSGAGLPRRG